MFYDNWWWDQLSQEAYYINELDYYVHRIILVPSLEKTYFRFGWTEFWLNEVMVPAPKIFVLRCLLLAKTIW